MAFWNQTEVVGRALEDWAARGLLDPNLGRELKTDLESQKTQRSFSNIAAVLGIICLAFGAMTFVAANWQEMSSFAKVATSFTAFWAAWGFGIFFKIRQNDWLAQAFVLLGCSLFGVVIMLLGQIYQLQGEAQDAVWLWWLGALIGSALTRSLPAFVLACILLGVWAFMSTLYNVQLFGTRPARSWMTVDYWFLLYFAVTAAVAWWFAARMAAHVLAAVLAGWIIFNVIYIVDSSFNSLIFLLVVLSLSLALKSALLISDGDGQWLKTFERPALLYVFALTLGLGTIWLLSMNGGGYRNNSIFVLSWWPGLLATVTCGAMAVFGWLKRNRNKYDLCVLAVFAFIYFILAGFPHRILFVHEAILLALTIWMVRMGWRLEYRSLTRWGFVSFAGVMMLIYGITIGSLIGTSTFYLVAGAVILLAVFLGPKLAVKLGWNRP